MGKSIRNRASKVTVQDVQIHTKESLLALLHPAGIKREGEKEGKGEEFFERGDRRSRGEEEERKEKKK